MSRYGRIEMGAPDVSADVAALKDLLAKGEISQSEYNMKLSKIQVEKLSYIVHTNGRYIPGKRAFKKAQKAVLNDSLSVSKQKHDIWKQRESRDQFIQQIADEAKEAKETTESPE